MAIVDNEREPLPVYLVRRRPRRRPRLNLPSIDSDRSWLSKNCSLSILSLGCDVSIASAGSLASVLSAGSMLSIGSAGSILSVGSAGSILSYKSAGSILSIRSAGSILATDATGRIGVGHRSGGGPVAPPVAARLATLLAVAGLLGALFDR